MNILVLNYEYPPIGGGGGVISKHIADGLAKLGHRVTVLTTEVPGSGFRAQRKQVGQGLYNKIYQASGLADISYSLGLGVPDGEMLAFVETGETVQGKPDIKSQKLKSKSVNRAPLTVPPEFATPEVIRLPAKRKNTFQSNPIEMLSWITVTKRFLKNWDRIGEFDICFSHFALPGGEVALYLKKKFNLPYVVMSHGHDIPWVHPRQMFLFHLMSYFRLKGICKNSVANYTQTEKMKNNIDRFLGEKFMNKDLIIPNGVDPKFKPDYSKRGKKLRILFAGRLVSQKDPMTFLKAIRKFSDYTRDFEVYVLGDGDMRKKMEKYVAGNGLDKNIKFLGKIHPDDMLNEYQSAHLMVAPSLNEGMSIAALEALASGVYLIATRASGFPDMISQNVNGVFVEFKDPGGIANALVEYYKAKHLKGYQVPSEFLFNFDKTYNWDKVNEKYQDQLLSL